MKLSILMFIPTMSIAFIHRLPAVARGHVLARTFHRSATRSNKLGINILVKENSASLSWPEVEHAQSYHVNYTLVLEDLPSLIVSSRNSVILNNLSTGVKYDISISPFHAQDGLLDPVYSGEICIENCSPAEKSVSTPADAVVSDITPLEIRVGRIVEVTKHPEADKLYIEKIDCGEEGGPRTIVSGLVPYCSEADLLNRKVIVLCNLKPRPLVGVLSHGMVLCASDASHSQVDPLAPPDSAVIGELIHFRGHVSDPKPAGNAAVKAFKRVADKLFSSSEGVATFDGEPFMTSAGPCTTSIFNGTVS